MATSSSLYQPAISAADLRQCGFTEEQIEHLVALRDAYPFIEFVESNQEWQRLLFLKWQHQRGDFAEV